MNFGLIYFTGHYLGVQYRQFDTPILPNFYSKIVDALNFSPTKNFLHLWSEWYAKIPIQSFSTFVPF